MAVNDPGIPADFLGAQFPEGRGPLGFQQWQADPNLGPASLYGIGDKEPDESRWYNEYVNNFRKTNFPDINGKSAYFPGDFGGHEFEGSPVSALVNQGEMIDGIRYLSPEQRQEIGAVGNKMGANPWTNGPLQMLAAVAAGAGGAALGGAEAGTTAVGGAGAFDAAGSVGTGLEAGSVVGPADTFYSGSYMGANGLPPPLIGEGSFPPLAAEGGAAGVGALNGLQSPEMRMQDIVNPEGSPFSLGNFGPDFSELSGGFQTVNAPGGAPFQEGFNTFNPGSYGGGPQQDDWLERLKRLMSPRKSGGDDKGGYGGIKTIADIASGLYGLKQFGNMGKLAAPGNAAADRLKMLTDNPEAIKDMPGYKELLASREQALSRRLAAQGYNLSGNERASLAELGGAQFSEFYGNEMDRLSKMVSGAVAPTVAQSQQRANAINRLVYGVSRAF